MSSSSLSLCSPSFDNSSFASTKFERRSRFPHSWLEDFRSLIISVKYDCIRLIEHQRAIGFTQWTYPIFRKTISSFPDFPDWRPLEEPLWAKHPDENCGAENFYRLFEAQLMPGRHFVVFPIYSAPKASGRDCHERHLTIFVGIFSESRTALQN